MAEYENREKNYNNSLGAVIGSFMMSCVEADSRSKDMYVERQLRLMDQGNPNAVFSAKTTLIGLDQALETQVSVPKIILTPSEPFIAKSAKITLDMEVSASTEDSLAIRSDTEVEGSAQIGFGIFSGGMKVKAALSVDKSSKRASHYGSITHAEVELGQGSPPEGLMKIIDALNLSTVKALELNTLLIEDQAQKLRLEATASLEDQTTEETA